VFHHLDQHQARAIALHRTAGLRRGTPVYDSGAPLRVPVSPACLGRLLDVFGQPLDEGPPLPVTELRSVHASPPPLHEAVPTGVHLPTGIKVIDLLCPFIKGGKTGLFGGAGVGKTVLVMAFMHAVTALHRGKVKPSSGRPGAAARWCSCRAGCRLVGRGLRLAFRCPAAHPR
jgi:F-type H+-transporting ATPase subunit beta